MKTFNIDDLRPFLEPGLTIIGDPGGRTFTHAKPITEAGKEALVWVNPTKKEKQRWVEETAAEIIICDDSLEFTEVLRNKKCFLLVSDPKLSFLRAVSAFFGPKKEYGKHPTAFVHPEAQVHPETHIGPFTYVGRCKIEQGTVIYGHVHLYDGVSIGKNVVIHAGTVIGSDGFGYARDKEGKLAKFPHIGDVRIEDDVEIGANTCIDRGTLGSTVIRTGAKIDNLVHISHNVVVGRHSTVIAHGMVGGSTRIGDFAWIAPSVALKNGISVGSHATAGMGAVVLKDIPDNQVWVGSPAKPLEKKPAAD